MISTRTLMHPAVAAACPVVLPAALLQGTGASGAVRFRTNVDVTLAAVDAAPPPRGAPV
jgi:hypothetical protein